MSKLISKNSIQRFKQGGVQKMLLGNIFQSVKSGLRNKIGEEKQKQKTAPRRDFTEETDKNSWDRDNNDLRFKDESGNWNYVGEGSTYTFKNGKKQIFKNGKWQYTSDSSKTKSTETKQVKDKPTSSRNKIKTTKPVLNPNRFVSIYDNGIWRKNAEEAGVTDRDSVKALQKKLGVEVDGIWGKNTNAAYEAWKQKNSTPVVETATTQTVQAPTVYQSTYDYNNADDFKNLGFNDYNSLKSWVRANPEHPFAKDMLERFKDTDLWTQNDIESALKVKGKYRSGYQGDLYDIRKSMQNYFKDQYNIDKNNEYTTQIQQNMNNMNNYVQNLANRFSFLKKQFKNGGQLVSRNPITRFRQGGMLRKLQNGYKIVGTDDQGQSIYQAVDSNAQAQIEAQAAKEVQDFLNSLRASKQQQEQEFSPVDAINTWKDIITVPKKEVTTKSQKKSSKNNSNKKNKGSQAQKKVTVTVDYATDPAQFPVDPMSGPSQYENIQWGRMYEPTAPYEQTRPYSPRRYGLGDNYYKRTMGFVAP